MTVVETVNAEQEALNRKANTFEGALDILRDAYNHSPADDGLGKWQKFPILRCLEEVAGTFGRTVFDPGDFESDYDAPDRLNGEDIQWALTRLRSGDVADGFHFLIKSAAGMPALAEALDRLRDLTQKKG